MTFLAKIRLKEDETAQKLLQTFFQEFDPNSSIQIKDGYAIVKVFFDKNPPTGLAEAIGSYKDIEFSYGESPEERKLQIEENQKDYEQSTVEVSVAQALPESCESTVPQVNEKKDENLPTVLQESESFLEKEVESKSKRNKKIAHKIPELDRIANSSMSFDDFLDRVIKWLEIEKKKDYFVYLVETASTIEKIEWKPLEYRLKENGIETKPFDKVWTRKKIAEKLSEIQSDGGILSVIKLVVGYKDFDFSGNIQKKVKSILIDMGLENYTSDKQELFLRIANEGVKANEEIDIDAICLNAGCVNEHQMDDARLAFSTFVNSFFKQKTGEMVKARDFIRNLKKLITTDEETLV